MAPAWPEEALSDKRLLHVGVEICHQFVGEARECDDNETTATIVVDSNEKRQLVTGSATRTVGGIE